jgi:hypothetical protein
MKSWAIAFALLGSGCMTSSYNSARLPSAEVKTERAEFYLYGLVGEKTVDLTSLCPQGVANFRQQFELNDVFMQIITCGIYCPMTIEVHCAGGSTYQVTPQPMASRALVVPMTGSPLR